MTELVITAVADTWTNSNRAGTNYSNAPGVRVKSGERYIWLRPELPNLAGATILDAYLVGRPAATIGAQTFTLAPVTERWAPGRITHANRPTVDTTAPALVAIGGGIADAPITIPGLAAMLQAVADGSDFYGWRLSTDSTSDNRFRSTDSGRPAWELHIEVAEEPEPPTNLLPDGGAVESTSPILAWTYFDFDSDSEQAKFRVQVDTPAVDADPDETAPDYDSGWVIGVDPEFDLTGLHAAVGTGPHYWRVDVEDAAGNQSGFSDWAEFTVEAMPELVIDAPTGPIGDPSPTILAHLASGTLDHWKAWVTGPDRADVRYRTGLQTGPIEFDVPLRNKDGRRILKEKPVGETAGWILLRVWPEGDWAEAVGQTPYIEQWIEITFDDDEVVAPTNLIVAPIAPGDPRHRWAFTCADVPEAFLFMVDEQTIARVAADDLAPVEGRYEWVDNGEIAPLRPHALEIRAVSGGGRSEPVKVDGYSHAVRWVWLIPEDGNPIVLDGTAFGGFAHSDRVATYVPLVGPEVDVIYDFEGLKGTFEGSIGSHNHEQDVWEALDRIEALRTSRTRAVRMVWGSQSIMARLRDVSPTSADEIDRNNPLHMVRFGFVEVG